MNRAGADVRAIGETSRGGLAGYADLTTTQRYMHLSPAATEDAIRLLDGRHSGLENPGDFGDILETGIAGQGETMRSAFALRRYGETTSA